ncbi:MAG TPA: class I SAM-dependent methyltransferase [Thermoanaerobaculia bacterium]|jgi:2-polyprenyl-3-methyl-5-hydroxy-6-metoxy-1,4-benzoquinol methylase|nr:class I SAM-dependent methyltransferase [Thermoanaerobaculia bacterium]
MADLTDAARVAARGAARAAAENESAWDAVERNAASEIATRFQALRPAGGDGFYEALARHKAHLVDHPCLPLHFEYAVTANDRGRRAADRILRRVPLSRRGPRWARRRPRVLDVGCAYGGFLVAFAERGASVTGIEVDKRYLALAEINLREQGVDAWLVEGDATHPRPAFRGRFDLVIANDVIEHVISLEGFLANIRDWLAPDGTAYLEIPNGAQPHYVIADGHYGLFGITLLEFDRARDYFVALNPAGVYDTYRYPTIDDYRAAFAAAGLEFEILDDTLAIPALGVAEVEAQMEQLRAAAAEGLGRVPEVSRDLVRSRLTDYFARAKASPRLTEEDRHRFLLDYAPGFWMVLARRAS